MKWTRPVRLFVTLSLSACAPIVLAQQAPDEDQARRQLESGRSFARQGNFTEAMKDFRIVAETYAASSVADNALLEIARYYFDVVGDHKEVSTAVETILRKYPTSDSAPEAYLITGRLMMAKSHQQADLDAALANFDRVSRLFPTSDAVPRSLVAAGEALWYEGRFDDAMASLVRAEVEYPTDAATAQAHLTAAQVLVSRGDPTGAMEELQQVRNRWPGTRDAEAALGRLTILHRLHVRSKSGAAYAITTEAPGPQKLQNVAGLGATSRGAIYWAAETGLGVLAPQGATTPPALTKTRGFALDRSGALVAIEVGALHPLGSALIPLAAPKPNATPVPLAKIDGAAQLYSGDWLVADDDAKGIHRFSRTGDYIGQFSTIRAARLAVNALDEIAAIDRDQKGVVFFDATGNVTRRIPAKGTGYDFPNIEDLAFDAFGYLYVLDRAAVGIFSPFEPAGAAAPPAPVPAGRTAPLATGGRSPYKLIALYTEPATNPNAFRRATAFALDLSGGLYLYDDKAQRVQVYR